MMLPDKTSRGVCLFKITRVTPTMADIKSHEIPSSVFPEKNNAATKILKAVCMELLI